MLTADLRLTMKTGVRLLVACAVALAISAPAWADVSRGQTGLAGSA